MGYSLTKLSYWFKLLLHTDSFKFLKLVLLLIYSFQLFVAIWAVVDYHGWVFKGISTTPKPTQDFSKETFTFYTNSASYCSTTPSTVNLAGIKPYFLAEQAFGHSFLIVEISLIYSAIQIHFKYIAFRGHCWTVDLACVMDSRLLFWYNFVEGC